MKRSEIIEEISELLDFVYTENEEANKNLSECILIHLERLGMLPPATKLDKLNKTDNAWEKE